jgi:hypothetical protein
MAKSREAPGSVRGARSSLIFRTSVDGAVPQRSGRPAPKTLPQGIRPRGYVKTNLPDLNPGHSAGGLFGLRVVEEAAAR